MSDENVFFVTPEIRQRYLQRRQSDIAAIAGAIDAGNFQLIAKFGHDWKGNGDTYGFPQFGQWGKELENAALSQNLSAIKEITSQVANFLASQS